MDPSFLEITEGSLLTCVREIGNHLYFEPAVLDDIEETIRSNWHYYDTNFSGGLSCGEFEGILYTTAAAFTRTIYSVLRADPENGMSYSDFSASVNLIGDEIEETTGRGVTVDELVDASFDDGSDTKEDLIKFVDIGIDDDSVNVGSG
ncbi:Oidioi.mRNA.OKI2018_I69.YSR.g17099.t1.cds [Oikopleura dioica]|uniref:Oidioi.mRNA.OKI2018_I69.YSR.g17099.t1.cds n=1 Tax=Oikopleura dioica TaxID=34765 RepID=A0ABN7SSH5_OIKDI|nr:Oidioi.mRNA.OKI2018_I69.YSR.g17099.t1.cds [Oikopleura dioica]